MVSLFAVGTARLVVLAMRESPFGTCRFDSEDLRGFARFLPSAFDSDVNIRHALFERPRWWPLYALGLSWSG